MDVREKSEWDAGHLDALHFPLSELEKQLPTELPQKKLLLYCRSGGRVLKAAALLRAQTLEVVPLKYGYEALKKAGIL